MNRRDVLKVSALLVDPVAPWLVKAAQSGKRVLVAGAGLAGLSCAWELTKSGHDVLLLEASDRIGGHVRTLTEGFPDGLYADCGAEHFTKPGYDLCYRYAEEFGLTLLPYPHRNNQLVVADGRMMPEQQAKQWRLKHANYNQKELDFLKRHEGASLTDLYLENYGKQITDEYQPFGCGLDSLDAVSLNDLLARDGASQAAIEDIGSTSSALHVIWKRRIVEMRGIPEEPKMFYRVKGGNEMLPLAMAERLGARIWKNSPVTEIRRGDTGATVTVRKDGKPQKVEG